MPYSIDKHLNLDNIPTDLKDELGEILLHSYKDLPWILSLLKSLSSKGEVVEFLHTFNEHPLGSDDELDFTNIMEFEETRMQRLKAWQDQIGALSEVEISDYVEEFNLDLPEVKAFLRKPRISFQTPSDIIHYFNTYAIAQEEAKQHLATALYLHHLRKKNVGYFLPRKNILLIGPSGTGKSYLSKLSSTILNVPYIKIDAASLVKEGIVGTSIADYIEATYLSLNDKDAIEHAIVFIDEFDKISSKEAYYGSQIQTELLNIIGEDGLVNIKRERFSSALTIPTENMLFILGGSFEKIIRKKEKHKTIGFASSDILSSSVEISREEIIEFGLIPEVINRVQKIVMLRKLRKNDLVKILKETKESELEAYQNFASLHGNELVFSPEFIEAIASKAVNTSMNARAIKNLLSEIMMPFLSKCAEEQSRKYIIDETYVLD